MISQTSRSLSATFFVFAFQRSDRYSLSSLPPISPDIRRSFECFMAFRIFLLKEHWYEQSFPTVHLSFSGMALLLGVTAIALGQVSKQQTSNAICSVPSGSKMKFKGVVISRDADNFIIRDRTRQDYQVRITDDTSIKTYGSF